MLNNGCISYILTGGAPEGVKDATVQVLEMKRVDSKQQGNAPVRYRLIISDGQHYTQAMLATQLNGLVDECRGGPHLIEPHGVWFLSFHFGTRSFQIAGRLVRNTHHSKWAHSHPLTLTSIL